MNKMIISESGTRDMHNDMWKVYYTLKKEGDKKRHRGLFAEKPEPLESAATDLAGLLDIPVDQITMVTVVPPTVKDYRVNKAGERISEHINSTKNKTTMKIKESDLKQTFLAEANRRGIKVTREDFKKLIESLQPNKSATAKIVKEAFDVVGNTTKKNAKTVTAEKKAIAESKAIVEGRKEKNTKIIQELYSLGDSTTGPEKCVGVYTVLAKTPEGDLRIELLKRGKNYLKQEAFSGRATNLTGLLSEHLKDSKWRFVSPQEIGQDTFSPILSDDYGTNRRGTGLEYDKIYWNPLHESVNEIDALMNEGVLILKGASPEDE